MNYNHLLCLKLVYEGVSTSEALWHQFSRMHIVISLKTVYGYLELLEHHRFLTKTSLRPNRRSEPPARTHVTITPEGIALLRTLAIPQAQPSLKQPPFSRIKPDPSSPLPLNIGSSSEVTEEMIQILDEIFDLPASRTSLFPEIVRKCERVILSMGDSGFFPLSLEKRMELEPTLTELLDIYLWGSLDAVPPSFIPKLEQAGAALLSFFQNSR